MVHVWLRIANRSTSDVGSQICRTHRPVVALVGAQAFPLGRAPDVHDLVLGRRAAPRNHESIGEPQWSGLPKLGQPFQAPWFVVNVVMFFRNVRGNLALKAPRVKGVYMRVIFVVFAKLRLHEQNQ